MVSLINKQLLLTAYAYLFIMEQQKAQQGGEALQLQVESTQQGEEVNAYLRAIGNEVSASNILQGNSGKFVFASKEKEAFGGNGSFWRSEFFLGTWERETQLGTVLGKQDAAWFTQDWTPTNLRPRLDEEVEIIWHLRKGTVDHSEIVLRVKEPNLSSTVLSFATTDVFSGTKGAAGRLCETNFCEKSDVAKTDDRSILVQIPGTFALKEVLDVIKENKYLAKDAPVPEEEDAQKYQWFGESGGAQNCHGFVRNFLHHLAGVELATSRHLLAKFGVIAIGAFEEEGRQQSVVLSAAKAVFKKALGR